MPRLFRSAAWILGLTMAFVPKLALAHTGHGDVSGFTHGFMHPMSGIDHVLAMVSVGLLAVHLQPTFGRRSLLLLPLAFVGMMVAGAGLAFAGLDLPFVDMGIAVSVVVFGSALFVGSALGFNLQVPLATAMGLVGVFALFHGYAHGAEMPIDVSGFAYGAGFVIASIVLQSVGMAVGFGIAQLSGATPRRLTQACGSAIALAGFGLVLGWIG